MNNSEVLRAAIFASDIHATHKGRDGQTPLINHVLEVAGVVAEHGSHQDIVIAALLHGVIEDSDVIYEDLVQDFGEVVAKLVGEVTDDPLWVKLSVAERTRLQAETISKASPKAQLLKAADRLCNTRDVKRIALNDSTVNITAYVQRVASIVENCSDAPVSLIDQFRLENTLWLK